VLLFGLLFQCNRASAANILNNPGFEADPIGQSQNIVNWNWYGQNFGNTFNESDGRAHTGTNYFKVFQGFTGTNNYNGIFQDNPAVQGNVYSANGWAYTISTDTLAGQNVAWIEVTFRDVNANMLALYRSALITTNTIATGAFPKNTWVNLPITNQYDPASFVVTNTGPNLVAPAGTSFVRYQVVFQGDALNSNGSMYFDDQTLNQISGTLPPQTDWNIVWSDEFNGTNIDYSHWSFETGTGSGGWGNNELEYYTSRPQNAYVTNGLLHIAAIHENFNGATFTSARMKSQSLFTKKYGRIEFRAKLPTGKGYWPALWMMPQDSAYGGWAASGEIDIMENKGSDPTTVLGTIHYGGAYPNQTQSFGPAYTFPNGGSVTNFHTYLLDWSSNSISWSVDGQVYETQTSWWSSSNPTNTSIRNPFPAPFNQTFYLIMNLAVGGNFDGNPTNTAIFPGEMQVDHVRVYDKTAPLKLSVTKSNSNVVLSWPANIVCHLQVQTNFSGISTNWVNLIGAANPHVVSPGLPNRNVFYRLQSP
jgi:beta-glucanase (GH16 family)